VCTLADGFVTVRGERSRFFGADAASDSADMGSNAVAFSGATTANGRGLLLGNPHCPWQGGRRCWQSQQTIPGELHVAGGSLLGSATISIGHNAQVAWSHTVATGITLNLHQLTLDPADPTTYLVDGRPERMTGRRVTASHRRRHPWPAAGRLGDRGECLRQRRRH
jgi:acyl-homoserine-lactone acylase